MPDREMVIKELEERIKVAEECMGNPIFTPDAIRTIVALLKEQPEVVRCSSCVFYHSGACGLHSERMKPEGYCSWAVPKVSS